MGTNKETVKLRRRELKNGNQSLYLDIYTGGKREYEFLGIYLVPEKTRADKTANKEKLAFAEAVAAKRIVELREGKFGFRNRKNEKLLFADFYNELLKDKKGPEANVEGRGNWGNWRSALMHLKVYDPKFEQRTMAEITPAWIEGFKQYLLNDAQVWMANYKRPIAGKKLTNLTARHYLIKLMSAVKEAMKHGLLPPDTLANITSIEPEETERAFLTLEELQLMAATPGTAEIVRRSFLFACLTGLRRSDILNLKWGDVQEAGGFTRIVFHQQKTGGLEYTDIAPQAVEYMGPRGAAHEPVFAGMYSPNATNSAVREWAWKAGIRKRLTFHCARHTFACLMLDLGTDIYTVSKLLGHRSIMTTQIYAKVIDKNKRAAVAKIPTLRTATDEREGQEEE